MNRVVQAIRDGRCVLAVGSQALQDPEVIMELRRRAGIPMVALSSEPVAPAGAVSQELLAPVLDKRGGILVLVEPEPASDGAALTEIGKLVAAASERPRLCIAARAFNPFTMPPQLRLLKMEQERKRARDFLSAIPVTGLPQVAPESPAAAPPRKEREPSGPRAPKPVFCGREAETEQLQDLLKEGGPVAVVGPPGVGRRWLLDRALAGTDLRRLPDLVLGWGTETDALLARLAAVLADAGDPRLRDLHCDPARRPHPDVLGRMAVQWLAGEPASPEPAEGSDADGEQPASPQPPEPDVDRSVLERTVMVVRGADSFMRDDGTFHRNGRLETLLDILFRHTYLPRLLFVLDREPVFYREAAGRALRVLPVGGLAGRELHEFFGATRSGEEVPRDRMGEVHNKVHGHPMATQAFAVSWRDANNGDQLFSDRRFLQLSGVDDVEPLRRRASRQIEKLDREERRALAVAANPKQPVSGKVLNGLGVSREQRIKLLTLGLLQTTPPGVPRGYYVHPLVRDNLPRRETEDFDKLAELAEHFRSAFQRTSGQERLAHGQQANWYTVRGRRLFSQVKVGFPDQDPVVDSLRGLIRGGKPRLDIAEKRVAQVLELDPANTEALLLQAELLMASKAKAERIRAVYQRAMDRAPTAEVYHHAATWYEEWAPSTDLDQAIAVLEKACERFPGNGRLHRRLAGLLHQAQQEDRALEVLRRAMELQPMMPDSYGLMGEILMDRGMGAWGEARDHIQEALRLAPHDPVHLTRAGRMDRLEGLANPDRRETLWPQAQERFNAALEARNDFGWAMVELATLILDRPEAADLDRVAWLLERSERYRRNAEIKLLRARLETHRGNAHQAVNTLERLLDREPTRHLARAALGEAQYKRGRIFDAYGTYKRAQEDSPVDSPWRSAYEVVLSQLGALIESGRAIEIQKQAEETEARQERERDQQPPPPRDDSRRRSRLRQRNARLVDPNAVAARIADSTETEPAVPAERDDAAGAPPSSEGEQEE